MKYKVLFTIFHLRQTPIHSGYRPDWVSDNKPQYNGAKLSFEGKDGIYPGEQYQCFLEPLFPELWETVAIKDVLRCMEGAKQIGEALIVEVS